MINFEARGFAAGLGCIAVLAASAFAITPNPNLSIGKNLYVDGAVNSNWKPEVFTDGHLDFNQVASASDFALNVGGGPHKAFYYLGDPWRRSLGGRPVCARCQLPA